MSGNLTWTVAPLQEIRVDSYCGEEGQRLSVTRAAMEHFTIESAKFVIFGLCCLRYLKPHDKIFIEAVLVGAANKTKYASATTLCSGVDQCHRCNPRGRNCTRCNPSNGALETTASFFDRTSTDVDADSARELAARIACDRNGSLGRGIHGAACIARFRDRPLLLLEKLYDGRLWRRPSAGFVAASRTDRSSRRDINAWLVDEHHRRDGATDLQCSFAVFRIRAISSHSSASKRKATGVIRGRT